MLHYLFTYLDNYFNVPGAGLFQYISFRAFAAILISLFISWMMGGKLIAMLRRKQVGETVRDLGLAGQKQKEGTPTMGGLIILAAIIVPTLLFAELNNIYVLLALIATVWMGVIGFLDDYIKVFKKDKKGLAGKFKVVGQIGLGLIVGSVMYFDNDITYKKEVPQEEVGNYPQSRITEVIGYDGYSYHMISHHAPVTSIPFVKEHEFNYSKLLKPFTDNYYKYGWLIYIPVVIFIITAISNGANLTDGIDGLATGSSAIAGLALAFFAYVSGNLIFSDYLNVMYIPNLGELTIFVAAFVGACVGFLWYNTYPAKVFMGDTGSLALGGIIASVAIMIRKELLLPILCGIFLIENLSVVMQVAYFKYTKRKYGEGRRIFLMSPLHHHYQKKGYHEANIVTRFFIIGIMLALLTLLTLKIR